MRTVRLDEFMPRRLGSVNPAKFTEETFELWSVPSFDVGKPEVLLGSEIGSSKKIVEKGDLLLSRIVPHIRRAWIVEPTTTNRQIGSGEWITFRSDDFHAPYLRHILVSDRFNSQLMQTVAGVGGSLLRARPESVRDIEIPLPPLPEQKRIAAILDQADALRRQRQSALDHLNQLGQSIFYEMFGDGSNTNFKMLGDHTNKIGSGATPRGGNSAYKESGIPLVRSMNVHDSKFKIKGLAFIDDEQAGKLSNVTLEDNDILLNITGASVARVCILPSKYSGGRVNQHVAIIRPKPTLLPRFLQSFLVSEKTKKQLLNTAEGGATRQAITKSQIQRLLVPVPSLTEQKLFVNRLKMVEVKQKNFSVYEQKSSALFASLQQRAFRGEL